MTKTFYDAYGEFASRGLSPIMIAGRNKFHEKQIESIVADVRSKLAPQSHECLLEIGCNVGLLLGPLARYVSRAVGQDHPDLLAVCRTLNLPNNVVLVSGRWPSVQAEGRFDCVLVYSVLQYLGNLEAVEQFIDACLLKLNPGGRLLLGDLCNSDARRRYMNSTDGQQVSRDYDEMLKRDRLADIEEEYATRDELQCDVDSEQMYFTDDFLLKLMAKARRDGFESYLLPQPAGLPFNMSREDMLIVGRR